MLPAAPVPLDAGTAIWIAGSLVILAALPALVGAIHGLIAIRSRHSLETLRALSPSEFEHAVARLYRRLGYRTEVVGGAGDGGIDVVATRHGGTTFIQCKRTSKVDVGMVRDFYGSVVDRVGTGTFVTTGRFTGPAAAFARDKGLELVDGKKLGAMVTGTGP